MNNGLKWDQENVNGVMLSLKCDINSVSPKSRQFTISYSKHKEKKGSWALTSLLLAVLFNIIALSYINISFTAIIIIIIVFSFFVFFWITHSVQSETLLVVPSVGVQSTVKYVYGREDNFVPWCRLDDVVIDEVIKLNRVLYYLTLLVRTNIESNEDIKHLKLMPVFKYTKPRLPMLEMVYNEIKNLLTEVIKENSAKGSGDATSSTEPAKH